MTVDSNQIEIRDILAMLWRRKWLIIIPVPVVAAITFAGTYLMTPQFESSTIIQIDPQIQLITDLQRFIGQPTGAGSINPRERGNLLRSMHNEITSTHYMELLDARMKLTQSPGVERAAQEYVLIQPDLPIEQARLRVLQEGLKSQVDISWASADQIEITVTSTSAAAARNIANNLGEIFVAERLRQDLNLIRSSQDFSDVQLEKYEHQVREKTAEVTELDQRLARLRSSDAIMSEANRSEIQEEIDQTDTEIEDFRQEERDRLSRLRQVAGLDVNELSAGSTDELETAQDELLNRLRQIGQLLSRYTWRDPQVINFKLRQNDLLEVVEAENASLVEQSYGEFDQTVRNQITALFDTRSHLNYLYAKKPYLEAALDDLTPSTDLISELEAQLVQLRTELEVATDIRDGFRRQQESSTISQAMVEDRSASSYRQMEPAKLPLAPFSPDRRKILVLGFVLGMAISGAAVLLVELLDNSFKKVEDVEETLGLKVLGISPKVDFVGRLLRR